MAKFDTLNFLFFLSDENCSQSEKFDTKKLKAEVSNLVIDIHMNDWRFIKFQDASPFVNFTIRNYSGKVYVK